MKRRARARASAWSRAGRGSERLPRAVHSSCHRQMLPLAATLWLVTFRLGATRFLPTQHDSSRGQGDGGRETTSIMSTSRPTTTRPGSELSTAVSVMVAFWITTSRSPLPQKPPMSISWKNIAYVGVIVTITRGRSTHSRTATTHSRTAIIRGHRSELPRGEPPFHRERASVRAWE
jgi:hypothetical protein